MKKSFLNQNFAAVYDYGLLINRNGCTLVAGSQKKPNTIESAYAYIPFPGNDPAGNPLQPDFEKVTHQQVIAIIKNVTFKI